MRVADLKARNFGPVDKAVTAHRDNACFKRDYGQATAFDLVYWGRDRGSSVVCGLHYEF